MLERPLITLTTDFGLKDPFVGLLKGVILGINPNAKIIDLSHKIQPHNIFEASHVLAMSYDYFPPATINLAVVDPGVGGSRRPILVITENHYFIGPDNGIFTNIFNKYETSHFFKVIHITASHYFRPMKGTTFHGRDIFAPVAAYMSKGLEPDKLGEPITDYIKLDIPRCSLTADNELKGEIVSADHFGNAISNISFEELAGLGSAVEMHMLKAVYKGQELQIVNSYSENIEDGLAAIVNSFGHIELFANQKSAALIFDIKIGDSVIISLT
ncbi:MAG: SAM-dependent chlorinase/fluorinase [Nitrospira sp.]|nr:SAM-dependent chlorinase/fluorinase [bacterium]MBL7049342.1 SAM-dependent chlorinase/fluorinase [Nitrospira sp.]